MCAGYAARGIWGRARSRPTAPDIIDAAHRAPSRTTGCPCMTVARVLIANRGEIAVRIIQACQALAIETVVAVSDADRESAPAHIAGRTVCIGPARAADSYLNVGAIIAAALGTGADAVHPGYGFLAESPRLAEACAAEGLTFIGP